MMKNNDGKKMYNAAKKKTYFGHLNDNDDDDNDDKINYGQSRMKQKMKKKIFVRINKRKN